MQRIIALAAITAVAIAATPALAKSKKHSRMHQNNQYEQSYNGSGWNGGWQRQGWNNGWNSRNVSDPSFGNRAGINYARGTGRCVTDLGYGRFEYCGW